MGPLVERTSQYFQRLLIDVMIKGLRDYGTIIITLGIFNAALM
jgi:hypothetical protein